MSYLENTTKGFQITYPMLITATIASSMNANIDDLKADSYYPNYSSEKTYSNFSASMQKDFTANDSIKYHQVGVLPFEEFIEEALKQISASDILKVEETKDIEIDKFFTQLNQKKNSKKLSIKL